MNDTLAQFARFGSATVVLEASLAREKGERIRREQVPAGALSSDLDGLRARVEAS